MHLSERQNVEILVVDDTPEHLNEWCAAVEGIPGCSIRRAGSLAQAERELDEKPVDLLITDLFLSRESEGRERLEEAEGLGLIERFRFACPNSRIIAISSRVGDGDAGAEAMDRGADDFISSQWLDVYAKALLEQKAKVFRSLLLRDRKKGNSGDAN